MATVTGRDRVWAALRGEATDRPPHGEVLIEQGWLDSCGFRTLGEAVEALDCDLAVLPVAAGGWPAAQWRTGDLRDIFLFGRLQGPVTQFTERHGWQDFSRLIIKQPLEARALLEEYLSRGVDESINALGEGCEGIVFFDDLAGDKGLLVSPKWLHATYFPLVAEALVRLECSRVPVIFHSDGNIVSIIPAILAAGAWGIQGLQPVLGLGPAVFRELKLASRVWWGNFDFEGNGRLKTIVEIERGVAELMTSWSNFPGYIFGSSGGLYKGLNWLAVQSAYRAAEGRRGKLTIDDGV